MSSERTACFPADKWACDKTDTHCSVALSKVIFLLIYKFKTTFPAKSPLLCMGYPPWREHR